MKGYNPIQPVSKIINGHLFELERCGLSHNQALNLAGELRRGKTKTMRAFGNSSKNRPLYRISKIGDDIWGVWVRNRARL